MIRTFVTSLKGALLLGATLCLLTPPARGQVVIDPGAACVATVSPVYYQGRASYWCGNQWYYQNNGAWGVYGSEPAYLHNYRGNHAPARHFYGRAGGTSQGRAGGGGHAGGGGGGHGHL
jgi:hypothetical protein